jgi:hypothetical protein
MKYRETGQKAWVFAENVESALGDQHVMMPQRAEGGKKIRRDPAAERVAAFRARGRGGAQRRRYRAGGGDS